MLSISTLCHHQSEMDIESWILWIKGLGFQAIELDYKLSREQLDLLQVLLKKEKMKVSSIHNFCPLPNDQPSSRHVSNYYRLSALDAHERKKAVEWTKNTIDTAVRFDAEVVVIHAGTIESEDDRCRYLMDLLKEEKKETEEFFTEKKKILADRENRRGPYLKAIEKSLEEVLSYAKITNKIIGLETRYYPMEIPNFDEIGHLLNLFASKGLSYWHDVGHAEINEKLGITDHIAFLEKYQNHLIGMHVHDMRGIVDHFVPFSGGINFNVMAPFLDENLLKVFELRAASFDELKGAVRKFNSL